MQMVLFTLFYFMLKSGQLVANQILEFCSSYDYLTYSARSILLCYTTAYEIG